MDNRDKKQEYIREQIIRAANIYADVLAGKVFLYVYGEKHFELFFPTDGFLHLSGVDSSLPAKTFYRYAKRGILTRQQFCFQRHSYDEAKRKLPCLIRLSELTANLVCVVEDVSTRSVVYKIGLTNMEFTLGLVEQNDSDGLYVPRTLRVKDKAIDISTSGEFVDFVLEKDASKRKYDKVSYSGDKPFPDNMKDFLASELLWLIK